MALYNDPTAVAAKDYTFAGKRPNDRSTVARVYVQEERGKFYASARSAGPFGCATGVGGTIEEALANWENNHDLTKAVAGATIHATA